MQLAAVFFVFFVCIVQHHRVIRMVVDLQTNGSEEREKRERGGVLFGCKRAGSTSLRHGPYGVRCNNIDRVLVLERVWCADLDVGSV